ncbi:Transcription initiation factor TFIID subunit 12 [Lamellibrachia satsuma]|nr:Transcription initiation factor TFIID subunit 12 [Lamellibrachia satsuma]
MTQVPTTGVNGPPVVTMNVAVTGSPSVPTMVTGSPHPQPVIQPSHGAVRQPAPPQQAENKVLDKRRLQELVKEIDPLEQLDEDVEEMLMQIADDFIDNVVTASCLVAKHRKSNTVEVKDVQLHLERSWNMWIPGFGSEELRPYKKVYNYRGTQAANGTAEEDPEKVLMCR